ncbi:hypothetical protein D3C80_2166590 [compost metagenome]
MIGLHNLCHIDTAVTSAVRDLNEIPVLKHLHIADMGKINPVMELADHRRQIIFGIRAE